MFPTTLENNDDFSQWQKDRVKARLFAYYYSKKRVGYSCNHLAYEICSHESTNLFDLIEEKYFETDNLNVDLGLPIRGNNLNKWFNGVNAIEGGNKHHIRKFHDPEEHMVPAVYKFLSALGWIADVQFVEPLYWPEQVTVPPLPNVDLIDTEKRELLPYFCRDFKLSKPADIQFLSITALHSDDLYKVRISGFTDMYETTPNNSEKDLSGHRKWDYLWGWMLPLNKQSAIIAVKSANPYSLDWHYLILVGSEKNTKKDKYASKLYCVILEEYKSVVDFEKVITSNFQQRNAVEHSEWVDSIDVIFEVGAGHNLTNLMKQYNIIHGEARESKWLFSSSNEHKTNPDIESKKRVPADALMSQLLDSTRGAMSEEKSNYQKMLERAGIPYVPHPLKAMVIEECTDPDMLGKRLHWCIDKRTSPEDIPLLIKQGVDINYVNEMGVTALHKAAYKNAGHHIRELVKHPDIDFLVRACGGATASMMFLNEPHLANPAIGRYLILKERQQAANSEPPIDYEEYMKESYALEDAFVASYANQQPPLPPEM